MKYIVRSKLNGKYLSHLFEDTHEKTYQCVRPVIGECYLWNIKETAEQVALENDGEVIAYE